MRSCSALIGGGVGKLLLELADLLLLPGDQGQGVIEFHPEAAVGRLQFGP